MAVRVHEPCSACQLQELTGYLASVQSDWNVVKRGYYAHVLGEADNKFTDPVEALKVLKVMSYAKHILLQFFPSGFVLHVKGVTILEYAS